MGLLINNYSYSYSRLQQLRQLALYYEGITIPIMDFYDQKEITTRFSEFIIHCDCEGIYVSKNNPNYEQLKQQTLQKFGQLYCYFGDLDKLKEEVQELNDFMLENTGTLKDSWIAFYTDVMEEQMVLEFH